MGSEVPFPFELVESRLAVPGVSSGHARSRAARAVGRPSRLASNAGFAGAHRGYITDLARDVLQAMTAADGGDSSVRVRTHADAEGRREARARVRLPCQVALEEYMACGIGGCAGCKVRVMTPDGPAMKRVAWTAPSSTPARSTHSTEALRWRPQKLERASSY